MKNKKLKPVKISKKIPKRELRKTLSSAIPIMLAQKQLVDELDAELQQAHGEFERGYQAALSWVSEGLRITDAEYAKHGKNIVEIIKARINYERGQKERAQADFERVNIGYSDKTQALDEARGAIDHIIAQLHDHAILTYTGFPDRYRLRGAGDITTEIIARVTEIGDNFSRARDEALAIAEREYHAEVKDVENRLESAYEEMRRERDAEVALRGMAERHLTQAGISARNAWDRVERLQRPWWRRIIEATESLTDTINNLIGYFVLLCILIYETTKESENHHENA